MSTAEWTRELEGLTTQIQTRCRSQQSLLERTNAAGDVERAKSLLRKYITQNSADVHAAKLLLKRLNDECAIARSKRVIQTTRALGASLQSAIEQSNNLEARLIERVRELESRKQSRHAAMHKYDVDDREEEDMKSFRGSNDDGGDDEQQLVTVVARTDSERLTAELFEAVFHERNVEISHLVEGVREINACMQDLNQMMIEQGEQLEEIEDNVTDTHQSVVKAATNLHKAKGWQEVSGKMWIAVASCIVVLVLIIVIVVVAASR